MKPNVATRSKVHGDVQLAKDPSPEEAGGGWTDAQTPNACVRDEIALVIDTLLWFLMPGCSTDVLLGVV